MELELASLPVTRQDFSEIKLDNIQSNLSLFQLLKLRLLGHVFVGYYKKPEWITPLPIFAFRCRFHGIQSDYPHGYSNSLYCYECGNQVREVVL